MWTFKYFLSVKKFMIQKLHFLLLSLSNQIILITVNCQCYKYTVIEESRNDSLQHYTIQLNVEVNAVSLSNLSGCDWMMRVCDAPLLLRLRK